MKRAIRLGPFHKLLIGSALMAHAGIGFLRVCAQEVDLGFESPLFWERFNSYTFSQGPIRSFADTQGGVYVVGNGGADVVGGNWYTEPIRLLITNAAVDKTFRSEVSGGFATALQPDGKVVISSGSYATATVVRMLPSGVLDPSFTPVGFDQGIRHLVVLPDGKILVVIYGNYFWTKHPESIAVPNPTLLRLQTNGLVDASFRRTEFGGPVISLFARPLADTEGRIYVGGRFTTVNGVARANLVRLLSNGEVDLSFAGSTSVPGDLGGTVREIALQTDGRLVAVGDLRIPAAATSANRIAAIRFTAEGQFDPGFATNKVSALGLTDYPRAMVMRPDDKFVTISSGLRQFNADGTRDASFSEQNLSIPAYWISRLSDGRLMVPGSDPVQGILVFKANGTPDPSFAPGGFGQANPPASYAILSSGRIAVCGRFNRVGTQAQLGLAILDEHTGKPMPSQPALGALTASDTMGYSSLKVVEGASNTVWFLAGITETDYSTRSLFGRLLENGAFDPAMPVQDWTDPNLGGDDLHALPNGSLLVVDNSPQGAVNNRPLRRLLPNGEVDTSFPGLDPALRSQWAGVTRDLSGQLAKIEIGELRILTPSGASHVLASLNTINGESRLIRLGLNGSQDATFTSLAVGGFEPSLNFAEVFNPVTQAYEQPLDGTLQYLQQVFHDAVELPGSGFLVCGEFHELNGLSVNNLVCLNADGSVNTNFSSIRLDYTKDRFEEPRVSAIEVDALGRAYVAGVFDRINGVAAPGLARLLPGGTVDPAFQSPISISPIFVVKLKLKDDYLYVFGDAAQGEIRRMGWRLNVGLKLGYDHAVGAFVDLLVPGDPYKPTMLQASDDLASWGDIFTNAAGAPSVRYAEPAAATKPQRFYRLRQ